MFDYRASIAIVTTVSILQSPSVVAQDFERVNEIAENITVKIISAGGNGSGVIFKRSEGIYSVITNQHVVSEDANYQILTVDGMRHQVTNRQEISGLDLAIVQFTSTEDYEVAEFGDSDELIKRQTVTVAGFPNQETEIELVDGKIKRIREIIPNSEQQGYGLVYDNETLPGSSGGAVLDEKGFVIAINGQAERDIQTGRDISRGIPINLFLAALDSQLARIPEDRAKPFILPDTNSILTPQQSELQGLNTLNEAIILAQAQKYASALPKAESAVQLAPARYETWAFLGNLYLQQQRVDEAITALETAEEIDANRGDVLFSLGNAYFQQQEYNTAVEKIEAGLLLKEASTGVLFQLGNAYFKLLKLDQALDLYTQIFAADRTFVPALINIGLVEYERGNIDLAIAKWQEAIKIDRGQAEPKLALAAARYTATGDLTDNTYLAEFALERDRRYQDPEFLRDNLWGEQLIADTEKFLSAIGY